MRINFFTFTFLPYFHHYCLVVLMNPENLLLQYIDFLPFGALLSISFLSTQSRQAMIFVYLKAK